MKFKKVKTYSLWHTIQLDNLDTLLKRVERDADITFDNLYCWKKKENNKWETILNRNQDRSVTLRQKESGETGKLRKKLR
ncbi:MAG: hypothetical protein ACE5HX_10200, partial [bacterium]